MGAQIHPAFRIIAHNGDLQSDCLQILPDHIEQIELPHAGRGIGSQFNAGPDVFPGSFQIPLRRLGIVFEPALVFFAEAVQPARINAVHKGSFAVIQFIYYFLPVDRQLDRFSDPDVVKGPGFQVHHEIVCLHTSLGNQAVLPFAGFVDRLDRVRVYFFQIEQIQLSLLEAGIHEGRIKNQEPGLFDRRLLLFPVWIQFQSQPLFAVVLGHHIGT